MSSEKQEEVAKDLVKMSFAEFLETAPPGQIIGIEDLARSSAPHDSYLSLPELQLHCFEERCNGLRFFRATTAKNDVYLPGDDCRDAFVCYKCSNCNRTIKTFAIFAMRVAQSESGICQKYGEFPIFGPPTPARLIKLIGPDRDLFLRGRRCENQGLGIGAFVYYRRVVEGQKRRIFEEIKKVAEAVKAEPKVIELLDQAISETQFDRAVKLVKEAIPQSLLINGHNPISLLHSALSEGVHELTEEQCLENAHSIRVVLAELSERLAQALKDEAELKSAIGRLLNKKNAASSSQPTSQSGAEDDPKAGS